MKKKIIALVLIGCGSMAVAQIPVIDANAAIQWISQLGAMAQQVSNLTLISTNTSNLYATAINAATMISGKSLWQYGALPQMYPTSGNLYGTSGGWISAINTGVQASGGYQMATIPVVNPGPVYSNLSSLGQMNFAANYSTVELGAGVAQNSMATTGNARAAAQQQSQALTSLQNSTLSDDPAANTEVGVLNKISGSTLINAQTLQGTNQLLSVMADSQTVANKLQHDGMVDEINNLSAMQIAAPTNNAAIWNGTTAAFSARIP